MMDTRSGEWAIQQHALIDTGRKRCTHCRMIKPLDEFTWRKERGTRRSRCKACGNAEWRRRYHLRREVTSVSGAAYAAPQQSVSAGETNLGSGTPSPRAWEGSPAASGGGGATTLAGMPPEAAQPPSN